VAQEIIKRQQRIADALNAEADGDRLMAEQDYEGAINKYRLALDQLPMGNVSAADRQRVVAKYAKVCVIHARELGNRGAFAKARALLNGVLADSIDPGNAAAAKLLKELDDPDRFNVANTEKHYENTEEVRRLFRMGLGYFDLGQFNKAEEQFNRVLAIDPTNTAARRQLEKTEREVNNYYRAARDHTRIKMLNDVDSLWVTPVPGTAKGPGIAASTETAEPSGSQAIIFKLNNITLDRLQFSDASIQEVVDYLRRKSIEADTIETDPNRKGVDFILTSSDGARPVTLDLRGSKLLNAIKSVCDQAGMRYRFEPNAVVIMPLTGGSSGGLQTRVFRVPPDFLSKGSGGDSGGDAAPAADPFASGDGANKPSGIAKKPDAKTVMSQLGVEFGEGATATFSAGTSRLVMRNTLEQLDNAESVIDTMFKSSVKQVFITTKFVEVTQRNTDELGFDTLIGAFNIGGGGVYGSGGTTGSASPTSTGDYSFISPGSGGVTGANPISRGLRFGADALSRNAIDALIAGGTASGASAITPATFALAGVFTDPQFQIMMRALSQKKGVDLMTAPSVIVRGGQKSKIEVIREFPYPTEFDPPQIPQTFGGGATLNAGGGGGTQQGGSFPVTPTTPQSFEFKNTGVTMEVEATVADDGYTIDLNLAPEVIEFEGFINYGSPIQTTGINALGQSEPVVLTDNKILQPVFATRKLATQVLIWDRQTVGIGGLIREDVQSVEDKVPLFGDIPVLGRLFRTKSDEHYKKNLMIYVTGTMIDPAGQAINASKSDNDEESAPPEGGPSAPLFPSGMLPTGGK
jgi:general secretion pathway protein D